MSRRNIPEEFKAEAVQLVVSKGYSFSQACEALGVGDTALRRWVARWREEQAKPPRTAIEIETDARRIRELEAKVADLERERDILKNTPRDAPLPEGQKLPGTATLTAPRGSGRQTFGDSSR
ncbi:transposase [Paraburkholderia solitsugae]|uniref:transposase n=1 Tax=Paraburkholderia solitsugae TaxID=2675748 RepID=UPI001C12D0C5|nr:transposase [Paraburkholderia solitsugae]